MSRSENIQYSSSVGLFTLSFIYNVLKKSAIDISNVEAKLKKADTSAAKQSMCVGLQHPQCCSRCAVMT
jgi:recombinational DNA repair protein RecR